jgi:hypothetical protein
MAALVAGNGEGKNIAGIAFGTSGNPPTLDDTCITSQFAKDITGAAFPETGQVEFSWDLFTNEANSKAIMEFGLLMADGTLFARKIRQTPQIRIRTSGWKELRQNPPPANAK